MTTSRVADLRRWSSGLFALEVAVELLIRVRRERLLDDPWVRTDDGGELWFDADLAAAEGTFLSGGEGRVLALTTRLTTGDHPVDLGEAITDIDCAALDMVLAALAHAGSYTNVGGSFEYFRRRDDEPESGGA